MTTTDHPPTLVCLIGPPAVGKTTVGQALCQLTGFSLFHGHLVADALSPFFPFGTPSFGRLGQTWRRTFFEEARRAELSVVTTVAWRFDVPSDAESIESWLLPYREGGRALCVELSAPLGVRLGRNRDGQRRRHKNPYWVTDAYLERIDAEHRYDSDGRFPLDAPHFALDIEHVAADEAARRIVERFGLPRGGERADGY